MIDFNLVSGGAALLADELGARIITENIIDKTPLTGRLELLFEAVKQKSKEFMRVLLFTDGSWCTHEVLEGKADLLGTVSMPVRHFQEAK